MNAPGQNIREVPAWLAVAFDEVGTKEIPGDGHNPRIIEYHQTTTLKATEDEVPWCSSFANWVMKQIGVRGTGSAAARSWQTWGRPLSQPVYGCVVVMRRGKNPGAGHVGFYLGDVGHDYIRILGGNQGDAVTVANFKRSSVIGYRWPLEYNTEGPQNNQSKCQCGG
jgi:uncharacterized protein (TIGR02594 family)